ncbi:MAG: hypothetical protein AVDCRST_MAG86-1339 [uncultured Truepera sp.]|uniref:Glucose/Sorbosone dehydrogenase domain-containing protein n=1 Tax=uncultured Truepera sp. TaxID=543023 RepID=A0A6J4V5U8_9DEIN|nr:MAG: hypothetical protein AVDCRST_MAG86-1339 [uncultured Truepera sp.]
MLRWLRRFGGWGVAFLVVFAAGIIGCQPVLKRLGVSLPSGPAEVTEISLPDGFSMSVFAEGLLVPRFMAVGPDGTVFVAELGNNRVLALPYGREGERTDEKVVVAEDLDRPSSLAFRPSTNELYVGETSRDPAEDRGDAGV